MESEVRYQTKQITVASSVSANTTQEDTIELETGYDRVTGIAVHEITDGSITDGYYRIGIQDQDRVYHGLTHIDNWDGGTGVSPNDKFKKIDFEVKQSQLVTIKTNVPASPSTDLKYEIVFRLERDKVRR